MALIDEGSAYRPVERRLTHIDSLRGLALAGVIVMNVGSMVMMFNARAVFASAGAADMGVAALDLLLVHGKARSAFAFLFGAGFAILLARAQAKGANFQAFYARRLGVLLLFGIVNQIFLFWGDILVTYALLGFLLMPAARMSDGALLRTGLALAIVPPLLAGAAQAWLGHPIPDLMATPPGEAARGLAVYAGPSYAEAVRYNAWLGFTHHARATSHMAVYDLSVFGLFLLGSWSVRTGILTDPARHRPLLRRVAWWGIPAGLAASAVYMLPLMGFDAEGPVGAAASAAFAGVPVMALGCLAALALLFSGGGARRVQAVLAPAGRMALTNYLASGAIGGWLFYGYGLGFIHAVGIIELTLIGIGLFLVLAGFSRLWLSAFSHGAAEWLWRRLSYGRAPQGIGRLAASEGMG